MVLPLFHFCVVWDNCGQGCKFYLGKLNRRAACIIEGRAVKSDELSIPYLAGLICMPAVTSLNLSLSISVSTD